MPKIKPLPLKKRHWPKVKHDDIVFMSLDGTTTEECKVIVYNVHSIKVQRSNGDTTEVKPYNLGLTPEQAIENTFIN